MYIYIDTYLRGKNSHLHICIIYIYRDMLFTCMYVGVPYIKNMCINPVGLMNF